MTIAILFPQINPVIFHIYGPIAIRWYSLAYIVGIMFGFYYLKYLSKNFTEFLNKSLDDIVTYAVLGIIIGGRLGYVIFYDLKNYLYEPWRILATWEGGMSFHGGVIGFCSAIYLFSKKHKIDFLRLGDLGSYAISLSNYEFSKLFSEKLFSNSVSEKKVTDVSNKKEKDRNNNDSILDPITPRILSEIINSNKHNSQSESTTWKDKVKDERSKGSGRRLV